MTSQLPQAAEIIYAEWAIKEGGVQAAVWTDLKGRAYIAVKTLNRLGKTSGLYDWQRCDRFMSDIVVGFIEDRPLVVRIRIKVTREGLGLIVTLPPDISSASDFIERRFSPWGSGAPPVSMIFIPTSDHYALKSFLSIYNPKEV